MDDGVKIFELFAEPFRVIREGWVATHPSPAQKSKAPELASRPDVYDEFHKLPFVDLTAVCVGGGSPARGTPTPL